VYFSHGKFHQSLIEYIAKNEGDLRPLLGPEKCYWSAIFGRLIKKFDDKSFVLDINFKKFSVQMRMG